MTKREICDRCKRPLAVCFCQNLRPIKNHWPVHIFQYYKESQHPLNTAVIAKLGLEDCQVLLSNESTYQNQCGTIIEQKPLLIYPGEDSVPLETFLNDSLFREQLFSDKPLSDKTALEKPRPLIFLDGTWRKTRRLIHESPKLAQLQKISIKPNLISRYKIRKAPNPDAISTLEAIVYVLSLLEQEPSKYQPLLESMDLMINKQIEMMGEETFSRNYKL